MDTDTNSPRSGEQRDRDRSRRGDRASRFSDIDNRDRSREKNRSESARIYVSNVPYEYRWQDLKDLFRREVGEVEFVELFADEQNKPRGCGICEFKSAESVPKALEKMNKYDLNGRQLVVKEDFGTERDKYGRVVRNNSGQHRSRGGDRGDDDRMSSRGGGGNIGGGMGGGGGGSNANNGGGINDYDNGNYNTYGLSPSFLEGLGIQGPLHTKVFVANLDYKVDGKKLKQVFKLAGRLVNTDLYLDNEGNSRGFAVVEYEHPVEAVQAISMLDRQMLFERRMTVRLDRVPDKNEGVKLPEGLRGIGIGLGPNGEPLRDVARNLPNSNTNQSQNNNNNNLSQTFAQSQALLNSANTAASLLGPVPNTSQLQGLTSNLAALSNVVGLSNLTGTSGVLHNPLLTSSLNSLGLGLGSGNDLIGNSSSNSGFNQQQQQQQQQQQPQNSTFNSGIFGTSSFQPNRSDYDVSSVRSYNTRPQDDFNQRTSSGGNNSFGGHNMNNVNNSNNNSQRTSDTIIITNLPSSVNWQTLRDKFREVGEVTFAEIRGQDTGVVRFAKERDAEMAIKHMDGARFEGRTVDVKYFIF